MTSHDLINLTDYISAVLNIYDQVVMEQKYDEESDSKSA